MNKFLATAAACALLAAPAFADGMKQNHHCVLNGAEVAKTRVDCKNAGGKWAKGEPTTAAVPAPAPTDKIPPAAAASRSPDANPALPANTPATPNNNSKGPPGDRTPGN